MISSFIFPPYRSQQTLRPELQCFIQGEEEEEEEGRQTEMNCTIAIM